METQVIGYSTKRQDAFLKTTGEALFIGDIRVSDCVEAKILRSPHPHARIRNIDTTEASKLPGVLKILTAADLPDRRFGHSVNDQPVLARDRVRFVGERVAAVAAVDEDTAAAALELIKVEYEALPVVTDALQAMRPEAELIHPELKTYRNAPPTSVPNVVGIGIFGQGDLEVGFKEADFVYEHTFRTPIVHQGFLEPHSCLAQINKDGSVKIWSNNKAPFTLRDQLAALLALPQNKLEVEYPYIGGDFGGKGSIMDEPVAYYLALACQRPVRITMSMREEMMAACPRHASVITLKSGLRKDGTIVARKATVVYDTGAYNSANVISLLGGRRALGAYRIDNTLIEGFAVYTNSVPAGHCRAPGDPQVFFAVESHTDMLAEAMGLDPYEFRRRNVLKEGDVSPSGLKWKGINALEVLDLAVEKSFWKTPKAAPLTGYGMALTERATGNGSSSAVVKIHSDGTATVVSGSTDPGTGSRTMLRQVVAQELQIPVEWVGFSGGNTAWAPFDNGSGSSRVTYITGQSACRAARDALNQVKLLAAGQLEAPIENIRYEAGKFTVDGVNGLSLREVLAKAGKEKNVIIGSGSLVTAKMETTCFAAQIAEVKVDPATGQVTVTRVVTVNDIGTAINPDAVKGQIEGAVVQAMGFALNEELAYQEGKPLVTSLADFKMPTAADAPRIESFLIEDGQGPGPFGAKAIGEQAISNLAPAIANAIYDAVGVRLVDLPLTPEKIRQALKKKEMAGEKREI